MMCDGHPLSPTDWALLRSVSKLDRPGISQILEITLEWGVVLDYHTAHTLLGRLVARGYLDLVQSGRDIGYAVKVDPVDVLRQAVEQFVKEVAGDESAHLAIVREVVNTMGADV